MRILLLTQYFPPETGAAQNRLWDLVCRLSEAEHEVTVLTSMPNYPQGRIFEQYRKRLFVAEIRNSVRICRVWCYVTRRRNFASRLLNYCSFAAAALFIGLFKGRRQDIVVVESPPLFLAITGRVLSRWFRIPMVVNVSDLWPASAVSMGLLRNKLAIKLALAVENHVYRNSYGIAGQTEGILEYVKARAGSVPTQLVTNGVDPARFEGVDDQRKRYRALFGFDGHFIVGFTGLHGLAYDFGGLLRTAELVQTSNRRVLFCFFGDGPAKKQAQNDARERGLKNVRFFAPQPAESMPGILSALDMAIIPLKKSDFFRNTLPSRLFESMAASLPVVLAISPGEATRLIERAKGGLCVPPEHPEAMADAVCKLAADTALCRELADNAKRYVCMHHDRREMARRFLQLLPQAPRRLNEPFRVATTEHEGIQL